jgi:hypothetical protein
MAAAAACAAVAAGLDLGSAPNTAVFLASGLALLTLAWIVGVATEQLGESSGPKIGGVLNATFGNAAEPSSPSGRASSRSRRRPSPARSSGTPCSSSARHSSSAASATAPRRSTGVSPG